MASRSIGPILALGGVMIVNRTIIHSQPMDWRIPIATGLAAGLFALGERAAEGPAVALAWLAFTVSMITRLDPAVPSPVETITDFWSGK